MAGFTTWINYGPPAQSQQANPVARPDLLTSISDSASPTTPASASVHFTSIEDHELNEATRVRRRNRQISSCLECRRRKLKCDKATPCTNCTSARRKCLYLTPANDPRRQQRFAQMKDRMSALEEDLASNKRPRTEESTVPVQESPHDNIDPPRIEPSWHEQALESTPLATRDNLYDTNTDDELMDLGVQIGKLRVAERIGGWVRPKLDEEPNGTLYDVMLRNSDFAARNNSPPTHTPARSSIHGKSYIGPSPDYIAPALSLFSPATHASTSTLDYLPSKQVADALIDRYATAVHLIARAVHLPTFKTQYRLFWVSITSGIEPIPSMQAVIFAAMFSAAVSMKDHDILVSFNSTRAALIDKLRAGTEMSLSRANFQRTTRLDTMQALVMYLIPLVRAEVSRAHSTLVGTAIRLAQCMGLHRDGSHYSMSAVEMQIRRVIWHQLCFLDMRTCEATGPSPQIRRDEHDTQFPLNVDDEDLSTNSTALMRDKNHWADMTLFRIRAELTELRRGFWFDMVQIDRKEKPLAATLTKIHESCQDMRARYGSVIDDTIPVQQLARCVLDIGMSGWFVQVLHRYIFNTTQRMPDALRQLLIENSLRQMENVISMETKPEFEPWSWYRGAINQFHAAILLTREVYLYPARKKCGEDLAMSRLYLRYSTRSLTDTKSRTRDDGSARSDGALPQTA